MMFHWRLRATPGRPVRGGSSFLFRLGGLNLLKRLPNPRSDRRKTQPAKPKPPAQKPAQSAAKPSAPAGGAGQPTLLGQFGDWGAYTASPGGRVVRSALAKPANSHTEPPNRPRDAAYVFIASRPADNVRNEVSIMFGYAFKPNAEASLEIGGLELRDVHPKRRRLGQERRRRTAARRIVAQGARHDGEGRFRARHQFRRRVLAQGARPGARPRRPRRRDARLSARA